MDGRAPRRRVVSALADHVRGVFCMRSLGDVVRANATDLAAVAFVKRAWLWPASVRQEEGGTVCADQASLELDLSVAVAVPAPGPDVARAELRTVLGDRAVLAHVSREPLGERSAVVAALRAENPTPRSGPIRLYLELRAAAGAAPEEQVRPAASMRAEAAAPRRYVGGRRSKPFGAALAGPLNARAVAAEARAEEGFSRPARFDLERLPTSAAGNRNGHRDGREHITPGSIEQLFREAQRLR